MAVRPGRTGDICGNMGDTCRTRVPDMASGNVKMSGDALYYHDSVRQRIGKKTSEEPEI